ncbi:hypothetical protein MIR68_001862 [Amoeboaphelidium protococcarum]|nr:hypothetical protein MIR68_001862 [Amoeboaphelidium protococcarum]
MKQKTNKSKQQQLNKQSSNADDIDSLVEKTKECFDSSHFTQFTQLPLSAPTLRGLKDAGFVEMTDIQRSALGYTLCGRDVLGAAKTGSGKSLAFLIPVLEVLYRQKWSKLDGLGALIISPTRELALQLFNVLRKIGKYHQLSAGLAIGGKNVDEEKERINRMNILICTPGRLLQHMDETAYFECNNLQMLILDEADRILDLGFKKTINAIVDFLPRDRQTLLFSATQTKSVRDLARLSLDNPQYVAVHEKAQHSTPDALSQHYLVCELYEKIDILYSFIKTHLQSKVIVFMSSCKQVRFVYEVLCKMQPGIVLMSLHGKQKQLKRNTIYETFCKSKAAVLFCTDIAARGLDFPSVDWVIQMDCPEDVDTYVHRAGRTARYTSNGNALLFLLPSEEEAMAEQLSKKKIPIQKIQANPSKTISIIPQLQSMCAEHQDVKYLAEKAFICYLRSVWLQKNKQVFDVTKLPLEDYAASLGLPSAPQVKFVRRLNAMKNKPYQIDPDASGDLKMQQKQEGFEQRLAPVDDQSASSSSAEDNEVDVDSEESDVEISQKKVKTKLDRTFAKKYDISLMQAHKVHTLTSIEGDQDGGDDDLLSIVRKDHQLQLDQIPDRAPDFDKRGPSVRDLRKQKLKNKVKADSAPRPVRMVFDDEGVPDLAWKLEAERDYAKDPNDLISKQQEYVEKVKSVLKEADVDDKKRQKALLKEKKMKKRRKLNEDSGVGAALVQLASNNDDEDQKAVFDDDSSFSQHQNDNDYEASSDQEDDGTMDEEELALRLLNNE